MDWITSEHRIKLIKTHRPVINVKCQIIERSTESAIEMVNSLQMSPQRKNISQCCDDKCDDSSPTFVQQITKQTTLIESKLIWVAVVTLFKWLLFWPSKTAHTIQSIPYRTSGSRSSEKCFPHKIHFMPWIYVTACALRCNKRT